ncbi:TRAP transporter small permease subunit [Alteromonas sp. CYL-A6]|uniref:TRAP transporter small permease subunit n=1 Tax=Alteromonas nitratireducens TaxID=3390813 RepID=UPI0034A8CA3A
MGAPLQHGTDIPSLPALCRFVDGVNRQLCHIVSIATLMMVALTFLIVVLRYGFNTGWIAMQESVMYLHAAVFMLAIPYTLRADGHVRVDVFYRRFSPLQQAWVGMLGTLLLLFPTCFIIVGYSWTYVAESWRLLESSMEAGGLPLVFLLKSLIPLSAVLLMLQGVSDIVRHAVTISRRGS